MAGEAPAASFGANPQNKHILTVLIDGVLYRYARDGPLDNHIMMAFSVGEAVLSHFFGAIASDVTKSTAHVASRVTYPKPKPMYPSAILRSGRSAWKGQPRHDRM
jgi:hypothetical protein